MFYWDYSNFPPSDEVEHEQREDDGEIEKTVDYSEPIP